MSKILHPEQLHAYQKKAVNVQCSHPSTMLWLDMGLGKTVITLTSLSYLIQTGRVKAALIVAPLKVIQMVWKQEATKWSHLQDFTFSYLIGNKDQRCRNLLKPSTIYMVNYENLKWLSSVLATYYLSKNKELPFDAIVWDEVSKMKNSTTQRVRAVKNILPHMKWLTGLTGTPAPNGYKDLHGQFLVVDKGERLGVSKKIFQHKFYQVIPNSFKLIPYPDTEEKIKDLISDITLEMSAEDYNPLPDLIVNDIEIELPTPLQETYRQMEKDFFIQLDSGTVVEIFNTPALMNKCLQFSNGAVYSVSNSTLWEPIHDEKLLALERIIEEAHGKPVLCSYAYRSDAERILKHFKHLKPINLTACKSQKKLDDVMQRWCQGTIPLLIGHPASMGHGIDGLQKTGNILVWFGLNWSSDLYQQFNARIRRQGQGRPVICHRILTKNTLDEAQRLALKEKALTQESLRKAIKEYRQLKNV